MQAQDEFSLGFNHTPRWLDIVIGVLGIVCCALILLPLLPFNSLRFVPSLLGSATTVLGVLLGIAALVLIAFVARGILQHLRRRERMYAAVDAWKLLNYAGIFYYLEAQFFPTLPATVVVSACSVVGFLLTGLGLPIVSNWYSRRHARRAVA